LWAKGVKLAREGAVMGEERTEDTWAFRVRQPSRPVAPTANLYPDDGDWDCDCGGRFDPCEHIAACIVAVAKSPAAADALFEAGESNGGIRYDLTRGERGLMLRRSLVGGDGEAIPLEKPLSDLVARRSSELTIAPTHADLAVDRIVGRNLDAPIRPDYVPSLLRALVGVTELYVDDDRVRASNEPLYPHGRVTDAEGGGVELTIEADSDVVGFLVPGVVRTDASLHPAGARDRFGKSWERLPIRRVFSPARFPHLTGTVIPELESHIAIDVHTHRLPDEVDDLAPWIKFDIAFGSGGIDVLPLLVYGDPPVARVDGKDLVQLEDVVPRREPGMEKQILLRLRDRLNLVPGRRVQFAKNDGARFLSELEKFDDGRPDADSQATEIGKSFRTLTPRFEMQGDEFNLFFEAEFSEPSRAAKGPATVDAEALVGAWQQGLAMVPLTDGEFAPIPEEWLAANGHLVAELLDARAQNAGKTPKAALPLLGELCQALNVAPPFELSRLETLLDALPDSKGTDTVPADFEPVDEGTAPFHGDLRSYQAAGVAWLRRLRDAGFGAVLADDMGLGKTIQALCVFRGRTLVVCPRSVIHNWKKELEKFRPDLSVSMYHGPGRELEDADVTLTTYATLRLDIEDIEAIEWDAVVLDEAQAIKNPASQVTRAAYRLEAGFRLSLSGTPVENRLDEMWSQMHFANRGLLGGRRDFGARYEKPILLGDEEAADMLRTRIRPFLLRRLKRDVAKELPPRTEITMYCELESEERDLYDAVRMGSREDVVARLESGSGVMRALEALLRLRQAACHPALLPGRSAATSSKVDALCEALDDAVADGHKALVFSQWTKLLDLVEPHLKSGEIPFTRLDGTTRNRGEVVEGFQSEDGPPVMLISLKAGGTGLNLTAADHVFLLDPWWNPAVEDQAADRAHRIGQERPVNVYRLVAKDTVEERVLDLQERKRRIADVAMSAGTFEGTSGITKEDILALLE
jgi:superfamily II DNA or RNA helicase